MVVGVALESGRLPVQLYTGGLTLSLKSSNLVLTTDVAWAEGGGLSALEVARQPSVGGVDVCDVFTQRLWSRMTGRGGRGGKQRFELGPLSGAKGSNWHEELLRPDPEGHMLFWLGLDAVCHHMLLERRGDRWRVLQSYVRMDRDNMPQNGYTGTEWCSLGAELGENNPAHRRYGGGRTLSTTRVAELLDTIQAYQEHMDHVILFDLLGAVWEKLGLVNQGGEGCAPGMTNTLPISAKQFAETPVAWRGLASEWAARMLKRIERPDRGRREGIQMVGARATADGKGVDPSQGLMTSFSGGERLLDLCPDSATRADELHHQLTGEHLTGTVLLRMINHMEWRRAAVPSGFTIRVADLKA